MRTFVKSFFVLAVLSVSVLLPGDVPAKEVTVTYPSGRMKERFWLDNLNRPHGLYQAFYDVTDARTRQQPLKGEAYFQNGLLHGYYHRVYLNGRPQVSATYKNGKLNAAYTEYSPKGTIIENSVYRDGTLTQTRVHRPVLKNNPPQNTPPQNTPPKNNPPPQPVRQVTEADIIAEMEAAISDNPAIENAAGGKEPKTPAAATKNVETSKKKPTTRPRKVLSDFSDEEEEEE